MKRVLDAGFYNFLVPFVESADEARRAVAATRYPPQGMRGRTQCLHARVVLGRKKLQ